MEKLEKKEKNVKSDHGQKNIKIIIIIMMEIKNKTNLSGVR